VSLCIKNIEKGIHKIQELLTELINQVDQHKHLWFANWRRLDVHENLEKLATYKKILHERVDLLVKVLAVQKYSLSIDPQIIYFRSGQSKVVKKAQIEPKEDLSQSTADFTVIN
jgi:hypothetical protein